MLSNILGFCPSQKPRPAFSRKQDATRYLRWISYNAPTCIQPLRGLRFLIQLCLMAVYRTALPWWHGIYLLFLPTLFTHSLYCPHLGTNLLVFVFAYVGCLLPFLIPSSCDRPFSFQGAPSYHLSPPSQHCLSCLVIDRLLLLRMHKSGISYAMPSCSKTLYILSD